jgi:hypothetical protein
VAHVAAGGLAAGVDTAFAVVTVRVLDQAPTVAVSAVSPALFTTREFVRQLRDARVGARVGGRVGHIELLEAKIVVRVRCCIGRIAITISGVEAPASVLARGTGARPGRPVVLTAASDPR